MSGTTLQRKARLAANEPRVLVRMPIGVAPGYPGTAPITCSACRWASLCQGTGTAVWATGSSREAAVL